MMGEKESTEMNEGHKLRLMHKQRNPFYGPEGPLRIIIGMVRYLCSVLRIRIRTDPHLISHPGSGSAWTDADPNPDPGGKKA